MDPKTVLREVLAIIDYKDDKNAFIDKFLRLLSEETMAQLIHLLSAEKQTALETELAACTEVEQFQEVIKKYFPKDIVEQKLTEVTKDEFGDYINTIYPTLTAEQQNTLVTYLSSLESNQQKDS